MASSYTLIGNAPTIQVLAPTVSQDVELATIQTSPTGIVATIAVSEKSFVKNMASETLTALANNIETIIGQGKAIGGTGTSSLDESGLTQYYVTFTVAYDAPGAPPGAVTTDVDVPVNLLSVDDPEINQTLLAEAEALVNNAYDHLVALSKG